MSSTTTSSERTIRSTTLPVEASIRERAIVAVSVSRVNQLTRRSRSNAAWAIASAKWRATIDGIEAGKLHRASQLRPRDRGAASRVEHIEVVDAREVGVEARLVDDGPDAGKIDAASPHRPSKQFDLAGRTGDQPEQHPNGGCLSGAVRADEAVDLGPIDRQVQPIDRDAAPKPAREVPRLDRTCTGHGFPVRFASDDMTSDARSDSSREISPRRTTRCCGFELTRTPRRGGSIVATSPGAPEMT